MRVGIFGGSFDPPHNGHLLAVQSALDALDLDRLIVVPAASQPLKGGARTPAEHRLAMTARCFDGVPLVDVDPIEIRRGGLSYTIDTVEALRMRFPAATLLLLIGEDVLPNFRRWREPERLLGLVELVVLRRTTPTQPLHGSFAGDSVATPAVSAALQEARRLVTRQVDVSSTEVRARVRAGRSIRGFVPAAVESYIATNGLYLRSSDLNDVSARA